MSDAAQAEPQAQQLPIENLRVAQPADTLGQTPHEPKVRPWELELLLSGALVFSLLPLPGQVDAWYAHVGPTLDTGWFLAANIVWIYGKLALYAVICGFAAHLAVRTYWVAVIGLEAVFPAGIRWENTRYGPIMREVLQESTPPLQGMIDRADKVASTVFAAGLMITLVFVFALLGGGTVALLSYLVGAMAFGPIGAAVVMEMVVFAMVVPVLVGYWLDRSRGDRLAPGGRAIRFVRTVGRISSMGRFALFRPLMLILQTNLSHWKRYRTAMLVMVLGGALLATGKATAIFHADGYHYLPDAGGALSVDPSAYEDQRDPDQVVAKLPSIQSDMIRDPYVRLFVPYRPVLYNDVIASRCPGVRQRPSTAAGEEAVLA